MRRVVQVIAAFLVVVAGAAFAPSIALAAGPQANMAPSGVVVCESQSNQPTRCPVPTSWRAVQLVQQLSQNACIEGRSWGFDFGSIWVSQGCRGRFSELTPPSNSAGIRCESQNNRMTHCRAPAHWAGAKMTQQLSQTACVQGRTWGFDRGYVWVDGGCRAWFAQATTPAPGTTVVCESSGNRPQNCRVPASWRAARLVEQLSQSACVEGRTWGFDPGRLWVSGGCRGRFAEAAGNWQPGPGWNQDFVMTCASPQHQYRFCEVDVGANGRVTLQRQTSSARCTQGVSWGWNRAGIWVNHGCAGEFRVSRRW